MERKELLFKYVSEKNIYHSITAWCFRVWALWKRHHRDVGLMLLALLLGVSGKAT